ncbi:hypothetical protein DFJ73DRAFT_382970 [Zopfochytrium polystomum]|nr:hypothetical protein DFJ73DRAFT_382970 [Zopfochytrium polystomum]
MSGAATLTSSVIGSATSAAPTASFALTSTRGLLSWSLTVPPGVSNSASRSHAQAERCHSTAAFPRQTPPTILTRPQKPKPNSSSSSIFSSPQIGASGSRAPLHLTPSRSFSGSPQLWVKSRLVRRYEEAVRKARTIRSVEDGIKLKTFGISPPQLESSDPVDTPEGVTPAFFERLDRLERSLRLGSPSPKDLRLVAYEIRTAGDAQLFKNVFAEWRLHPAGLPHSAADNFVFFETLMKARCHSLVLDLACQRRKFAFNLNRDQIHVLMAAFRREYCEGNEEITEEARLELIDQMYKSFALLPFSSIPPDAVSYTLLVTAGAYGPLAEGWRRSVITAKEQLSLGLALTEDARLSLVAGSLQHEASVDLATSYVPEDIFTSPSYPRSALILVAKMHALKGDFERAVKSLEAAATRDATPPGASGLYGHQFWPTAADVGALLRERLDDGDLLLKGADDAIARLSA